MRVASRQAFERASTLDILLACPDIEIDGISGHVGMTPLMGAAQKGRSGNVVQLLAKGANVFAQNRHHKTALHLACLHGHVDTAKVILDHLGNDNERRRLVLPRDCDPYDCPIYAASCDLGDVALAKLLVPLSSTEHIIQSIAGYYRHHCKLDIQHVLTQALLSRRSLGLNY